MTGTGRPIRAGFVVVLGLVFAGSACGALRQNLKNQFVSYRGAWHCPKGPCRQPKMVRSTAGHREGDVKVSHVKLQPRAALVFNPGTPVDTFSAKISCGGQTVDVPENRIKPPGQHKISGQSDSWMILIDAGDYPFDNCRSYRVLTHSTWENGKREYDEPAGVKIE